MLTSLVAITLCLSPSFGDLDGPSSIHRERRLSVEASTPSAAAATPAADSSGFSASPLLTAEGRAATLLTLEQSSRLREIDAELKTLAEAPVGFKVLSVVGLLIVAAPLTYAGVMAVVLTSVVIAELGVLGVVLSPFVFTFGLMYSVPLWGWAVALGGLALVGLSHVGATAAIAANAPAREALMAERTALVDAMNGPSSSLRAIVPLTTISSF